LAGFRTCGLPARTLVGVWEISLPRLVLSCGVGGVGARGLAGGGAGTVIGLPHW
jgi:hypothetical protein